MSFIPEYDRPELPGKDDPEALGLGRDFFRGIEGCDDEPAPPAEPVSAEFGTLVDGFWGPFQAGGQKTFPVVMAPGETLFFLNVSARFDDWDASPPFSFPEGWENAINPASPFAGVQTRINQIPAPVFIVPYVYRGDDVLTEVTLTVRTDAAQAVTLAFGITLSEGAQIVDWLGAGGQAVDTAGVELGPGSNALASGKRFALVHRELIFGGIA